MVSQHSTPQNMPRNNSQSHRVLSIFLQKWFDPYEWSVLDIQKTSDLTGHKKSGEQCKAMIRESVLFLIELHDDKIDKNY